jgi:hypothetical protein
MSNIQGKWTNQNGSTVEFDESNDGQLTGVYRSRKGRSAAGKDYALRGQRNGEIVSFQVNWQDADHNLASMTSFSGRLVIEPNGQATIHTVWVLARQFEDEQQTKPTAAWNAFMTNADVFRRDT